MCTLVQLTLLLVISVFRALADPQSTNPSLSPSVSIFPPVCRDDACIVRPAFPRGSTRTVPKARNYFESCPP